MRASTIKFLSNFTTKLEQIVKDEAERLDDLGEKENKENEYAELEDELEQLDGIVASLKELLDL